MLRWVMIAVVAALAAAGLVPIVIAASVEGFDDARATYDKLLGETEALYRESAAHYRRLREELVSVEAPDPRIGLALEWGKVALDKGFVCNPHLGCGLVAGLGPSGTTERPGFGWYFGGDAAGDAFGSSVSVSGDNALVGAPTDDGGAGSDSGSVYVFQKIGGVWTEVDKLTASDGVAGDDFGGSIALDGNSAIIGARGFGAGAA